MQGLRPGLCPTKKEPGLPFVHVSKLSRFDRMYMRKNCRFPPSRLDESPRQNTPCWVQPPAVAGVVSAARVGSGGPSTNLSSWKLTRSCC